MEIERKFLVATLPDLSNLLGAHIQQAYLSKKPEVRVRKKTKQFNEHYFLTVKSEGSVARDEFEIVLSDITYKELLGEAKYLIEKTRYEIPLSEGLVAELDVYDNPKDLVVVEVEFINEDLAQKFVPPSWMGKEVTNDPSFKNKNLAREI